MKKFNDNRNVIGNLIKAYREKRELSKTELARKLELLGIELDRFELYKIETGKSSVKDFELIGLCIVLNIDFEELKKLVQ
ncbi:MAG: helix-turn-helix transcriptional regulator [Clostridia bacterium]|nr:helix-turn-helix transcriptional regulator [Clostridia bacterium]